MKTAPAKKPTVRDLEAKLAAFEIFLSCVIPTLPDAHKVLGKLEAIQADPAMSRRAAVCWHLNQIHHLLRATKDTNSEFPERQH